MPSYENGQPYGRWSEPARRPSQWQKPPQNPRAIENVLHSSEVQVERKFFSFQIRENSRGRILRITEEGNGKRNSIIIPASGLKAFQTLVEEMAKAAERYPPKAESPS
jgi:hypothetical protein